MIKKENVFIKDPGKLGTFHEHAVACHGKGHEIARHDRILDHVRQLIWPE